MVFIYCQKLCQFAINQTLSQHHTYIHTRRTNPIFSLSKTTDKRSTPIFDVHLIQLTKHVKDEWERKTTKNNNITQGKKLLCQQSTHQNRSLNARYKSIFKCVCVRARYDFDKTFIKNKWPTMPYQSFLCGCDDIYKRMLSPIALLTHSTAFTIYYSQSNSISSGLCSTLSSVRAYREIDTVAAHLWLDSSCSNDENDLFA